jgi:hypothetical protein
VEAIIVCSNTDKNRTMIMRPNIKGLSEKFRRIGNLFNIKTNFKRRNTTGSILRKLKAQKDLLDKPQSVYRVP